MNSPMSDDNNYKMFIAGVDEAGRGPLAGPVTAAAVILQPGYFNARINDSKKLSIKERDKLYHEIIRDSLAYSIVSVGAKRIDKLNILRASLHAMELAAFRLCKQLNSKNICFLIDGNFPIGNNFVSEPIIKGDGKIQSIAAASILAKVTRDRLMDVLETRYPGYEFSKHKGYPTKLHMEKITELRPSRVHRSTFRGVKEHIAACGQ